MSLPKRYLITSALPYANGPLHLGHLVGYIQADIWVRARRMAGGETHFVCADDAHGTPIMLAAEKAGQSPEEFIRAIQVSHEKDFADFGVAFDHYHSTHSDENRELATLIYERLRDGKSYATRRVTAIQHGEAIFSIMVSFHADEEDTFNHQDPMPDVPTPDKLTAEEISKQPMFREMPDAIRRYYESSDRPIELRPVELGRYIGQKIDSGRIHLWIRTVAKLPDDPALHMCALAYASDFSLLDATTARYGRTLFGRDMMTASLDHAMWFHRPFRADEWLLYAQDSPSAQGGRGFTRGMIFKPDGTLVASVAQEGSVRQRK